MSDELRFKQIAHRPGFFCQGSSEKRTRSGRVRSITYAVRATRDRAASNRGANLVETSRNVAARRAIRVSCTSTDDFLRRCSRSRIAWTTVAVSEDLYLTADRSDTCPVEQRDGRRASCDRASRTKDCNR